VVSALNYRAGELPVGIQEFGLAISGAPPVHPAVIGRPTCIAQSQRRCRAGVVLAMVM